ncbi:MAG TPA: hypothetical protein ENH62_14025 [Marinobacter sp.]|uniref:Uncharacterized protein n=1 Tax=marine sediment metagenome TaxID=412755 RepID=A0A0F9TW17_9ZZZZ|nr:hypothetical protein [Marinobacter sp.]
MQRGSWIPLEGEITVAHAALTNAQRKVSAIGNVLGSTNSLTVDLSHRTEEFLELRAYGTGIDADSNILEVYAARGENDDYTHVGTLTCTTGTMVVRGGSDLYIDTFSWSATDDAFELFTVNGGNNDVAKAWLNTNGYDRLLFVVSTLASTDFRIEVAFVHRIEMPGTSVELVGQGVSLDTIITEQTAQGLSLDSMVTDLAALEVLGTVTKAVEVVDDWTAVAQNTIVESSEIDVSANKSTTLMIQAFLDTTTVQDANGADFIIQGSAAASGDEDWHDISTVAAQLVGTATTDLIEDNPLAAAATSLTLTGHALTVEGIWIGIEDGTLANSELIFVKSQSTNAVVALDGTTNSHALNTAVFNVALSRVDKIDNDSYQRLRVLFDNTQDPDGSSFNYKLSVTKRTF